MEVRKLTDSNDWLESERVIETAFLHPWDEEQSRRRIEAQAEGKEPRAEESWGLFDDSGAMVTSISTLRHRLSFGGKPIGAGEIHMVGSIPEQMRLPCSFPSHVPSIASSASRWQDA